MNLPEYPGTGVELFPWLRRLYGFVRTLELKGDGKTCRIDRTSAGSVLHVIPSGTGAANAVPYTGPFRLGFAESGEGEDRKKRLHIQHGGNPASTVAGIVSVNGTKKQIAPAILDIKAGFVWVWANIVTNSDGRDEIKTGISINASMQGNGAPIGEIIQSGGEFIIIQYPNAMPVILLTESC